jgi:protein-disulfide isomerase
MSKQFWGIIIAIVVVFVGVIALTGKDSKAPGNGDKASTTNHTKGAGTAGVTLVEYGDFQCPYCGLYYPTVQQVQQTYGDKLKFQFVNFPLTSLHRNAFSAARAAEAAGLQGKYWEMYDKLYQNQNDWSSASDPLNNFNAYAKSIGLNVARFDQDYASSTVNDLINADMAKGNDLKLTATPTFYLNGKKIEPTNNPQDFEKAIDAAIADQAAKDNKDNKQ